jgi:hypothetical protein
MGTRQIRFCDISGSETEVASHELFVDQMRVEIDLSAAEYRKLLALLQPYIDAGRVEAAALPRRSADGRRNNGAVSVLSAGERAELRSWAERQGIPVPSNNRFKMSLVERWRAERGDHTVGTNGSKPSG